MPQLSQEKGKPEEKNKSALIEKNEPKSEQTGSETSAPVESKKPETMCDPKVTKSDELQKAAVTIEDYQQGEVDAVENKGKQRSAKVMPLEDSMDEELRRLEEEEAKYDEEMSSGESDDDEDEDEDEDDINESRSSAIEDIKDDEQNIMMPTKKFIPPPPPKKQEVLRKANKAWGQEEEDDSDTDSELEEEKEEVAAMEDELDEEGLEGLGHNYRSTPWKKPEISVAHKHGKSLRFAEGSASLINLYRRFWRIGVRDRSIFSILRLWQLLWH